MPPNGPRGALARYLHQRQQPSAKGEIDGLWQVDLFDNGVARQSERLITAAAFYAIADSTLDDRLLWAVFQRHLARLGQSLAEHAENSNLLSGLRDLAVEVAQARAPQLLVIARSTGRFSDSQLALLARRAGEFAAAWYVRKPPLAVWRDVEELAALMQARAALDELSAWKGAPTASAAALTAATNTATEAIVAVSKRLSDWLDRLDEGDSPPVPLDARAYSLPDEGSVWSEGFWLSMLEAALRHEGSRAISDALMTSGSVTAHRAAVQRGLDRQSSTPVVVLPEEPWLNAAADEPLDTPADRVLGHCWRGTSIFINAGIGQRLSDSPDQLHGTLIHEMIEDIQSARPEQTSDAPEVRLADAFREGATELLVDDVLAQHCQVHHPDEPVGYPVERLLVEGLVISPAANDRRADLLAMVEAPDVLQWIYERLGASDGRAKEKVQGDIEDERMFIRREFGWSASTVSRRSYEDVRQRICKTKG